MNISADTKKSHIKNLVYALVSGNWRTKYNSMGWKKYQTAKEGLHLSFTYSAILKESYYHYFLTKSP